MLGASMLTLGSCTDLSETIYSEIASEQYEFSESDNQGQFATVYSSLRDFYWAWYGYADYGHLYRLMVYSLAPWCRLGRFVYQFPQT